MFTNLSLRVAHGARTILFIALAAGAVAAARAAAPRATAAPLPVETYAELPRLGNLALSPDGRQFAALLNDGDRTVLITRAVDGDKPKSVLSTDNREFRFRWMRWANNDRLLVSVVYAARRDFVATTETRLLSIKADGTGALGMVRAMAPSGSLGAATPQQIQDRVVDWLRDDGRHVLIEVVEPGRNLPGVHKVDVDTGRGVPVRNPERDVRTWVTDAQHRVRVGVRRVEHTTTVLASAPDSRELKPLWTYDDAADAVYPLGFGKDPQELWILAPHEGYDAVFTVRLDDPALKRTLRFSRPGRDVEGYLIRSPKSGEVIGLMTGGDAGDDGEQIAELWDPVWRPQLKAIDLALPGRMNRLVDISQDEQRYLLYSSGNGRPGVYYFGDRSTGDLIEVGAEYPELAATAVSGKQSTTIRARDGLQLATFTTLPRGRKLDDGGAPLPLVLLPHGGPASRDGNDFDIWSEFLASRGYAVLQVNFRGSVGYGTHFRTRANQRWGFEMQDDLTDAVQWAVKQGFADPGRVCIVGGSYGGYAALMGVVKTPELYRCAISFAGVTDLPDMIAFETEYIGGREWTETALGKAWGDRERLRATSPARQAERIQAPVLLAHGSVDRVVPVDQSEAMASALKKAGKPYKYVELEGGDHHLSRYSHRLTFFKAMEAFLGEHLAPRPAATKDSQASR